MICAFFILLVGYLLGSIPFGLLAGKMKGIDVRHHGSGNIGATNVFRVLGKQYGITVFLLDTAKGLAAVLIGKWLSQHFPLDPLHQGGAGFVTGATFAAVYGGILGGVGAIIGHSFPVWLKFKGGKGVASSLGVVIGLVPLAAAIAFSIWVLLVAVTRYVSVGSIFAALSVPIFTALLAHPSEKWPLVILMSIAALLIVLRHKANIQRLMNGTEHRFGKKPAQS